MLRKHINITPEIRLNKLPFYAWECITLYTNAYIIDLAIPDQEAMDKFLKLLIHHMNTMDGQRDSAKNLKDILYNQEREKYQEIISRS